MLDNKAILEALKTNLADWCKSYLSMATIIEIFPKHDFKIDESLRTKKDLIHSAYNSANWSQPTTIQNFITVIEHILQLHYISDAGKNELRNMCLKGGLAVNDWRIDTNGDLFKKQFPVGLPFGTKKPSFAITALQGSQSLEFEISSGMGMIRDGVYPKFTFLNFQSYLGITTDTNEALRKALSKMPQTQCEKDFLVGYAKRFKMTTEEVPLLIPQAWIQWHSSTKKERQKSASDTDMHRVDFVAFWNNQRYIILIDDIGHYAEQQNTKWIANEKKYTQRLQEDRWLQNQGWHVFRVSNWEIKNNKTEDVLQDLRLFIGFY